MAVLLASLSAILSACGSHLEDAGRGGWSCLCNCWRCPSLGCFLTSSQRHRASRTVAVPLASLSAIVSACGSHLEDAGCGGWSCLCNCWRCPSLGCFLTSSQRRRALRTVAVHLASLSAFVSACGSMLDVVGG